MEKLTKKAVYEALVKFAETGDLTINAMELKKFAENEINLLDKKHEKAKETAAKKKAADELMKVVCEALSQEIFEPIATITERIGNPDITVSKVTYRLTQLVKNGLAEKAEISVEDSEGKKRRIMGYKAVVTEDGEVEPEYDEAEVFEDPVIEE
jgi:Zn finger protein HypA/HybF involved in hydrogenase expression